MASSFPLAGAQWQEVAPGTFERGLDPIEKMIVQMAANGIHNLMNFRVKLSIGGEELVGLARKAWIAMRYQHPSLASKTDATRECFIYKTPSDDNLKQWLGSSFKVIEKVNADTHIVNGDVATVRLIVFPKTSELVLQMPHVAGDGPGGVSLVAELIGDLANPPSVKFGSEIKNLNIALTTFLGIKEITNEDRERCKEIEKYNSDHRPNMGLPKRTTEPEPKGRDHLKTIRKIHTFTIFDTEKIIKACKAAQLTATHVFHAAIIKATQALDTTKNERFTENAILSWREKAGPEIETRDQGFGSSLLVSAWPFSVTPGSKSLVEVAGEMKKWYTGHRDDESLLGAYAPYYLGRTDLLRNLAKEPTPSIQPLLSSWGLLEKKLPREIGGIEVLDFGFGIEASGQAAPMTTFLWTFRDRMVFTITTKEYHSSEDMVDEFVGLVVKEVRVGLDIDS